MIKETVWKNHYDKKYFELNNIIDYKYSQLIKQLQLLCLL